MMKTEKSEGLLKLCAGIVSILGIICLTALLFPIVQRLIIALAEEYLIHRKVSEYDDWMHTLSAWARGGIALILAVDFFALTGRGRKLFVEITGETRKCLVEMDLKSFLKPFLLMAGVYLLGMTSIIRADFLYVDDVDRAVRGYHGWNGWSRHLADILSTFIHADTNLGEISPLPQILGVLLISLATVLLVRILCEKPGPLTFLAGIPLGLSPYFLENLSYKFDAPYMGLSVLAAIVPFLFFRTKKAFAFLSVISLLVMCMTYQSSSGIYVMITLMLLYRDWNSKRKTNREILASGGIAAASFIFSLVIFRFAFMVSGVTGHGVSTVMLPLNRLFPGIVKNLETYISCINEDFGLVWKAGVAVICIFFIINSAKTSQQKGIARWTVPFLAAALCFVVSYGAYTALESPLFEPRSLYGFGVFIAIVSIALASIEGKGKLQKPALISIMALNWCFLVFAFSYGNALADQKRYNNFRTEILLQDLSRLFPNRSEGDPEIRLVNGPGTGPFTANIARHYPVIKRLVREAPYYHTYKYMNAYFHWERGNSWDGGPDPASLPEVFNSYYHTIQSDGKYILVTLRHN